MLSFEHLRHICYNNNTGHKKHKKHNKNNTHKQHIEQPVFRAERGTMSHRPTRSEDVKRGYSEAALIARREAQRAWRAKNKEKVAEHQRRYWEKRGRELISKSPTAKEA